MFLCVVNMELKSEGIFVFHCCEVYSMTMHILLVVGYKFQINLLE